MLQVVNAPDARLRIKTKPVKKIGPALSSLTKEMIKLTLSFKDPEGVGLAATQIGLNERFFVGKVGEKDFKVFINPKIIQFSKRVKKYFEGCLSIPDYYGEINRSTTIKVSYQDLKGVLHKETLKAMGAWIFQHEVDHLDGILFPDRVLQQKGRFFKFTGRDKRGQDMYEEVTL
ncbi:MAG: peptide deformylase [Candidatus Daviesbacteria bacterium]|nr:peptide deformylase [Candidatus Daviesbacteria bacterium]